MFSKLVLGAYELVYHQVVTMASGPWSHMSLKPSMAVVLSRQSSTMMRSILFVIVGCVMNL